jgi:hypothetical protein
MLHQLLTRQLVQMMTQKAYCLTAVVVKPMLQSLLWHGYYTEQISPVLVC